MIPQIKEINFPEYATLSTATVTLTDMGDKTITAQVKIDGSITPDFSYDWEIEFQGERYIQPLREPQASKGNDSMSSVIDLTFYHKGIYDLKRYFFVSVPNVESGIVMADDYIVPLQLNLKEFVEYLNKVFEVYQSQYKGVYTAFLNSEIEVEDTNKKTIDINYTKIWDVINKIYEWFGVRWRIEEHDQGGGVRTYRIHIGYTSVEVSHTFEYGFEGGLLKFERQVQASEIANVVFGRGSSENIPYRYFKSKDDSSPSFPADPDWIPELENVYFANLRGKTFRDYVKGWKAKHYGGEVMSEPTEEYTRGYNDEKFSPIEYVKDDESIDKYGEIQKGLEHNEEIKPSIQGVSIDGIGRVDQIVDVEEILVDENTEDTELVSDVQPISENVVTWYDSAPSNDTLNMTVAFPAIDIDSTKVAHIVKDVLINIVQHVRCTEVFRRYNATTNKFDVLSTRTFQKENPLKVDSLNVGYLNENTNTPINDLANIDKGVKMYVVVEAKVSGFEKLQPNIPHPDPNYSAYTGTITPDSTFKIVTSLDTEIDYTPIHGQILGNYESGATRESQTVTIPANSISQVVFETEHFTISEDNAPATSVDMPFRVTASLAGAQYDTRPNVVAINANTDEQVSVINLPAGTYYLQNSIQITNLASQQQTFKVELLPTYIYYSYDSASWKPTFDIWVKNVWTTKKTYVETVDGMYRRETDEEYATRVWDAILGNHLGNDAKVVFSSGWLSGHSDWEFPIAYRPVYDTSKTIDGVPSEWRITLYKSDAEMEATSKWIPSIATHANAGDHFFFTGIELPHQYVLWAEEKLDEYKRDELDKVSNVDSTIVVQLDKVRVNQLQPSETRPLLDSLRVGNNIKVADSRFIQSPHETLHLQSVTYTWDDNTTMTPNVDIVLSNSVQSTSNPFVKSDKKIKSISKRLDDKSDDIDNLRIKTKSLRRQSSATRSSLQAQISSSNDEINTIKAAIGVEKDWQITTNKIKDGAITSEKIAHNAVLKENLSLEVRSILSNARGVIGDDEYILTTDPLDVTKIKVSANVAKIDGEKNGLVDVEDLRDYLTTKLSIRIVK